MGTEIVAGVVAESLLEMALSLAAEEFSRFMGLKDDLESLAGELGIIRALVADADSKHIHSEAMQLWLKTLEVVASYADDILEEYKYEVIRRKVEIPQTKREKVRSFFSPIGKLVFRLKIAHKIKDINSNLKNIKEKGIAYGLNPSTILDTNTVVVKAIRVTSPAVQEAEIVGRDNDVKEVVDVLVNAENENCFAVYGIKGMPGQGKTTLAQLICKNEKVVNHFQHRIWVCVSENFQVDRVLNEMVQYVTRQNLNLTNRQALILKLQETLKGERYLLVLDDVWNEDEEEWECMKEDLQEIGGCEGTKILVTTRSDKVLSTMHPFGTFPLSQLSYNDSWTLFKRRAFAEGGVVESTEFVTIGKNIVKKCQGLPLAIKALGSLLYSKKDKNEWLSIENDLRSSTHNEGVRSSIKLSFNHLSSFALKQCFVYCSMYPKNTKLERKNLVQVWMALGFLNSPKASHLQMEDLGNNYFDILLSNSLFQHPTFDDNNKVQSCKMHDLVHDFATEMSKDYCFTMKVGQDSDEDIGVVHLSSISLRLRTLYLLRGSIENTSINYQYLRLLILGDTRTVKFPTAIDCLKLLRFMDVERTRIKTLPPSYIKLYNLQTLKIRLEDSSKMYVGTLINLRHIYFPYTSQCILVGLKELVNLQTIPYFVVSDENGCQIEELSPLKNLRDKLIIYGLDNVKNGEEARKANLSGKSKIDHIELHWGENEKVLTLSDEDVLEGLRPHSYLKSLKIANFKGSRFPSWMTTNDYTLLHSLVKITLRNCDSCEQLPTLGHLPHLKSVDIFGMKNVKCIGTEFYGCINDNISSAFPALRKLSFRDMKSLQVWLGAEYTSVKTAFPQLTHLTVMQCEKLAALPTGLRLCTSLETIQIFDCASLHGVDGLEHLPNLKNVEVGGFSEGLDHFPWPQSISSVNMEDTELYFASLEKLTLWGWPKLSFLPQQLQHLPSLKALSIREFKGLESLPNWLGNIQSLQSLHILNCKELISMPSQEAMLRLTNLQELRITDCGRLKERCTVAGGQEWHKLVHIPTFIVDDKDLHSKNSSSDQSERFPGSTSSCPYVVTPQEDVHPSLRLRRRSNK